MRGGVVNELEERRVVRLLGELSAHVDPLSEAEVRALVDSARRGQVGRARRRPRSFAWSRPLAAALAGAVVAGFFLQQGSERTPPAEQHAVASGELVSFPEGSALQLLIRTTARAS